MARIEVIKGFANAEECAMLNAWAEQGVVNKWLDLGMSRGRTGYSLRLTSRFYGNRFQTPEIAQSIFERIRNTLGLPTAPIIEGHGKDGVVVSYTYQGGDVYPHIDSHPQVLGALRCNIISQMPGSGGELFVGKKHVPLEAGDLHCYLASHHEHYVTEVRGSVPRILWMFGLCVPVPDWEFGNIKIGEFA